jgi:hypothetical protein
MADCVCCGLVYSVNKRCSDCQKARDEMISKIENHYDPTLGEMSDDFMAGYNACKHDIVRKLKDEN